MTALPGLLLDVDGPIASPVTRSVSIPSILDDLVALTRAGAPVAFITGRSYDFVRDSVIAPLAEHGLLEALAEPGARMFVVVEKGSGWAAVTAEGLGELTVDYGVALPASVVAEVRTMVEADFAETMFFDETKRAMISVEQQTSVDSARYLAQQPVFEERAFEIAVQHGIGIRYREREQPDAAGLVPFRIEPTIISTDIESVALDKDRGAERALAYFSSLGELPGSWRSVGDSRSDYLMADHVHAIGLDVAHVDVRPADGILDRDYPIITEGDLVHDEAGAAFLRSLLL
jgi:hypothetical protein